MAYFKKIVGERVYLSPMSIDDLPLYALWTNEQEIMNNLGIGHFNNSTAALKEWFEETLKNDRSYLFGIVKQSEDRLIGTVEFMEVENTHKTATLAIFIGDILCRNKGLGAESLNLALGYAFDVLNLNNIALNVYSFNERAIKTYTKAGFKEYGRRRKAYYLGGNYYDIICMDILKKEFYERKAQNAT